MVVCNRVSTTLWQAGRRHWPAELPPAEVAIVLTDQPVAFPGPKFVVAFRDTEDHELPEATYQILRTFAYAFRNHPILTVCEEGKNRSGLASALVLMARGWDVEDAIAQVKATATSPGSVEALSNRRFLSALREYR